MSNATLAVYGRLGSDPREHSTRTGKAMTTASLAVNVPDRSRDADEGAEAALWLRVTAFGRLAEDLARHAKGDPVSVCGRLQFSRWTDRDGDEREQWQVLADALVSARTVRPGGGRRKSKGDGDGPRGDDRYPDARHSAAQGADVPDRRELRGVARCCPGAGG